MGDFTNELAGFSGSMGFVVGVSGFNFPIVQFWEMEMGNTWKRCETIFGGFLKWGYTPKSSIYNHL